MAKREQNRAAMLFVDLINDPTSEAYADLCAMCIDSNGLQSDRAAAILVGEIRSDLRNLLTGGDLGLVKKKIILHTRKNAAISWGLRYAGKPPQSRFHLIEKKIRLGQRDAYFDTWSAPVEHTTAHRLVYGVLRRLLESDEISRLAFCEECEKLFFRKSTKGRFCDNDCRWANNRRKEERKLKRRKGGVWKARKRRKKPAEIQDARAQNDPQAYLKRLIIAEESDQKGRLLPVYKKLGGALPGRKWIQKLRKIPWEQIDPEKRKTIIKLARTHPIP
jgi:hypothetical protein